MWGRRRTEGVGVALVREAAFCGRERLLTATDVSEGVCLM